MEIFIQRRSHLQSNSYRTLSRILSHCLKPKPNSDASVDLINEKNRIGSAVEEVEVVQSCDLGRKNEIFNLVEETLEEEENCVGGLSNNEEWLDDMICDLSSLIDVDIGGINVKDQKLNLNAELDAKRNPNQRIEGFNVPIINEQAVNKSTELDLPMKEIISNSNFDVENDVGNSKDQILSLIGELDAETGQNQQIEEFNGPIAVKNSELDSGMEKVISNSKLDEIIGVENSKDGSLELENKIMQDESNLDNQLSNSIDVTLIGELDEKKDQNQQIEGNNTTEFDLGKEETISSSKFDQLNEVQNPKDGFLGLGNEITQDPFHLEKLNQDSSINKIADFEEGEIEDEVQLLEQELDIENNVDFLNNNKLEVDLVNNTNTNLGFDNKEEYNKGLINESDKNNNEFMISDSDEALKEVGKKRKRVLTKERKAKKKKVSRIKRAKKLREDGVHRLRIPLTIKKEKEKQICKFFLNGRCQQGDKCKFSHDAVPLTKSKPCNHFARGECLKGDDCPYDHNLQKYPCHKFISEGFCNRGPNCKFSHTIQAKEDSLSDTSKLTSAKDNNSNNIISSSKISSVQKTIGKPTKIPKGIKFLSFKKDSIITLDGTRNQNEESSLPDLENSGISNPEFCSSSSNLMKVRNEAVCGEVSEASKILQEFLFSSLSPFN